MSGDAPVDPAEIPVFTGHLPTLDEKVKLISSGGAAVATKTSDVHLSDPFRAADDLPGPRPDTTPGGHAPDNMPRNSSDTHTPGTSGGRPETLSAGGHANTPSTGGGSHLPR
ncbi:hypothetical protein ACFWP3_07965 [Streptomyces sp. NPDC058525]|uniref:hypothetical protein n=1 Tax=Streptomyces sp. NPDC058525 TaxID=3346538 RepID=UPI0036580BEB